VMPQHYNKIGSVPILDCEPSFLLASPQQCGRP
jgi:hypothetical protein